MLIGLSVNQIFGTSGPKSLELTQGLKKEYKLGEERAPTTHEFQSISVQRIQMVPAIGLHIPEEAIIWSRRLKCVAKFDSEISVEISCTLKSNSNSNWNC